MIVAHKAEDGRLQSIEEHALQTAQLAQRFAEAFGCGQLGYAGGLCHDLGKLKPGFQRRILENGPKVEHSAAGAQALLETKHLAGLLLAYCIAGHHTGLPDSGSSMDTEECATLHGKMARERHNAMECFPFMHIEDVRQLLPSSLPIHPIGGKSGGFSASFLIRMLFSCLVDADFLDTEAFMRGSAPARDMGILSDALFDTFQKHIAANFSAQSRPLDKMRCQIRTSCENKATGAQGVYSLTVPTGGGKTLSSLAFALRHAKEHHLKRVIYVIPYTSIIEQTAAIFKGILGEGAVLEHHSGVSYDDREEEMSAARLASENWAAPLIVTTNVQFFESLFANRTSKCRKLHHIANSVIIFDEAQMLPVPYLRPCIWAISELVKNYGCTAVLMSATQPALDQHFPDGMKAIEICENTSALYTFFRRTRIAFAGEWTQQELAARMCQRHQALCIVNTRKQAQTLYNLLPEEGRFHLSTLMPPILRKQRFEQIKQRLSQGLPCLVVSTSLIEAGVDLDFPVVFREEAGLDSQIQAAGRCNREGKRSLDDSIVYVFRAADTDTPKIPSSLRLPIEVAKAISETYTDVTSPEAIRAYFSMLYQSKGAALDQKDIIGRLEQCARANFPLATIAADFRLIESETAAVLIPLDEKAKSLAAQLKAGIRNRSLMQQAAQYHVSVYRQDMEKLAASGLLDFAQILHNHVLIRDDKLAILDNIDKGFNPHTGLVVPDLGVGLFV